MLIQSKLGRTHPAEKHFFRAVTGSILYYTITKETARIFGNRPANLIPMLL
jgi:hypothetical protein